MMESLTTDFQLFVDSTAASNDERDEVSQRALGLKSMYLKPMDGTRIQRINDSFTTIGETLSRWSQAVDTKFSNFLIDAGEDERLLDEARMTCFACIKGLVLLREPEKR